MQQLRDFTLDCLALDLLWCDQQDFSKNVDQSGVLMTGLENKVDLSQLGMGVVILGMGVVIQIFSIQTHVNLFNESE